MVLESIIEWVQSNPVDAELIGIMVSAIPILYYGAYRGRQNEKEVVEPKEYCSRIAPE